MLGDELGGGEADGLGLGDTARHRVHNALVPLHAQLVGDEAHVPPPKKRQIQRSQHVLFVLTKADGSHWSAVLSTALPQQLVDKAEVHVPAGQDESWRAPIGPENGKNVLMCVPSIRSPTRVTEEEPFNQVRLGSPLNAASHVAPGDEMRY